MAEFATITRRNTMTSKSVNEVMGIHSDQSNEIAALTAERDKARAQLVALHAAAVAHVRQWHAGDTEIGACDERLDATLADLATAAAEHDAAVRADERAKALNEAADRVESLPPNLLTSASNWQRWLRAIAAEDERR